MRYDHLRIIFFPLIFIVVIIIIMIMVMYIYVCFDVYDYYIDKDDNIMIAMYQLHTQVADIGTLQRLPLLIGYQQSLELTYTGRYN